MKKVTDNLSSQEIRDLVSFYYPDFKIGDIEKTPLSLLKGLIKDKIGESENISCEIKTFEDYSSKKHIPAKKKKAHRIHFNKKCDSIQRIKSKWKEPSRKTIPITEESTNRGYLNKKSSSYVHLKRKKDII